MNASIPTSLAKETVSTVSISGTVASGSQFVKSPTVRPQSTHSTVNSLPSPKVYEDPKALIVSARLVNRQPQSLLKKPPQAIAQQIRCTRPSQCQTQNRPAMAQQIRPITSPGQTNIPLTIPVPRCRSVAAVTLRHANSGQAAGMSPTLASAARKPHPLAGASLKGPISIVTHSGGAGGSMYQQVPASLKSPILSIPNVPRNSPSGLAHSSGMALASPAHIQVASGLNPQFSSALSTVSKGQSGTSFVSLISPAHSGASIPPAHCSGKPSGVVKKEEENDSCAPLNLTLSCPRKPEVKQEDSPQPINLSIRNTMTDIDNASDASNQEKETPVQSGPLAGNVKGEAVEDTKVHSDNNVRKEEVDAQCMEQSGNKYGSEEAMEDSNTKDTKNDKQKTENSMEMSPSLFDRDSSKKVNEIDEATDQEQNVTKLLSSSQSSPQTRTSPSQLASYVVMSNSSENSQASSENNSTESSKTLTENQDSKLEDNNNDRVEYEEVEFEWDEYLEDTGAQAAPPTAFTHVESSLESSFVKGMLVEVRDPASQSAFWLARLEMSAGQLLMLRWCGMTDGSHDFWKDAFSPDVHPVGWCRENAQPLAPPSCIKVTISDVDKYVDGLLENAKIIPPEILDAKLGSAAVDLVRQGQVAELTHDLDPTAVWPVRVLRNVGGRLLLRHVASDEGGGCEDTDGASGGDSSAGGAFWLFYLYHGLHPLGWGCQNGCVYTPPPDLGLSESEAEKVLVAVRAENNSIPPHVFKGQEALPAEHLFEEGQKLEALHPQVRSVICPATVVKVINATYFIVEIDDLTDPADPVRMCCHGNSLNIFPPTWCSRQGLRLTPPIGWQQSDFDWADYLKATRSRACWESAFRRQVDHQFEKGMKLEAVRPGKPDEICAATITRIVENLLWLHLDSSTRMVANHIVHVASHDDLFPVGWCESNGYPLTPPRKAARRRPKAAPRTTQQQERLMTADEYRSATYHQIRAGERGAAPATWSPLIYFNHRCFSGPFLSKGRIAELPRYVGPGPVTLVMAEVLSQLINVAYKPSRVLRELQMEGAPNPSMAQQLLKAKYKGKSYRATVEVCQTSEQIEEFCRAVCIRLECCPNLFSASHVIAECPENCSQLTKTKYSCYYKVGGGGGGRKKKRKQGRPPGGHTNLEDGPKKPGKRRGRKPKQAAKQPGVGEKRAAATVDEDDSASVAGSVGSTGTQLDDADPDYNGAAEAGGPSRKKKRKYTHFLPPPSDIKTRGVKLPSYSTVMFERRPRKTPEEKERLVEKRAGPPRGVGRPPGAPPTVRAPLVSPGKVKTGRRGRPPKYLVKSATGKYNDGPLTLNTNPLYWTVLEVIEFFKATDCAHLVRLLFEQDIDGQALLLLNLPTVQEFLDLKLGPAVKFCHHIERLKVAFYTQFADAAPPQAKK